MVTLGMICFVPAFKVSAFLAVSLCGIVDPAPCYLSVSVCASVQPIVIERRLSIEMAWW
jgi:hypothetical protein